MTKPRKLLGAMTVVGLALLSAIGGCDITEEDIDCSRLRDYSCECFPACQQGDIDVTSSQDSGRCKERLKQQYEYWKTGCQGRCQLDSDCLQGWGSCAARYYGEVGLTADGLCTRGGSGGTGPGDARAD